MAMVFIMEYMTHETHCSFMDIFRLHHRLTLQMNGTMNYVLTSKRSWRRTNVSIKAPLRKKMILILKKMIPTFLYDDVMVKVQVIQSSRVLLNVWEWLHMYDKNLQKRIMERVVKNEEEEDIDVEDDQAEPEEPKVPPPEKVSREIQTDDSFLSDHKTGSSSKEEAPAPSGSSQKGVEPEEKKDDIQHDDTAPKKEPATRLYHGQDITGNEDDSIFRELSKCFTNNYYDEWSGFYNQGYPASSQHRHMFWHVKYRGNSEPRKDHWYTDSDKQLMEAYIARGSRDSFSCSHWLCDYVEQHGVLPYCVVLQCLASQYLGAGLIYPSFLDKDHPYRSSPQFSLMFWNLGNWCRSRFNRCPLPEKLQKFETHINDEINRDLEKIGDKPQFNNYFINVVKNVGAHLFVNYEAQSLYISLQASYLRRSNSKHASMIIVTSWLLLVWEETFDKLLVTKLTTMTRVPDTYHGQYSRFCGAQLWTETQKKRSPSLERGCPCAVCVCLSRRTRKYFQVAKYLRRSSCMYVLGVYPFSSWRDRRRRK